MENQNVSKFCKNVQLSQTASQKTYSRDLRLRKTAAYATREYIKSGVLFIFIDIVYV